MVLEPRMVALEPLPLLILLFCFSWKKLQKKEGPVLVPKNSVLTFLWKMLAKLIEIEIFLIVTNLRKCFNLMFNNRCCDRGGKIISTHNFMSLLTFRAVEGGGGSGGGSGRSGRGMCREGVRAALL